MKLSSTTAMIIVYILVANTFAYTAGKSIEAGEYASAGPSIIASLYFIAMVIKNSKTLED